MRRYVMPLFVAALVLVAAWSLADDRRNGPANQAVDNDVVFRSLGPPVTLRAVGGVDSTRPRSKATTVEQAVDRCVLDEMASFDTPGASVAILLDGELLYESGYGVKHRFIGGDVEPDTVFRIGSITKQMTAAAVMQLVDAGAVDLRDPVTLYAPEFHLSGRWSADDVTVRHLLTHSSAFPDSIRFANGTDEDALSEWAAAQGAIRLHAPPGKFWNYSNPNFMLAGLVVERASGMYYRDYIESRVWESAGMTSTTFDPQTVFEWNNYTWGHHQEGGSTTIYAPYSYDNIAAGPAGWAFSTADDLVRWADLLMTGGGEVLEPASALRMQQQQIVVDYAQPDTYYGYGIMRETYRGVDLRGHGGNIAGWGSYLLWAPDHRFAVAVLANTTYSLVDAAYCIVDVVLEPTGSDPPAPPSDPATWARYEGRYELTQADDTVAMTEIRLDGGRLLIDAFDPNEPDVSVTFELIHFFGDTFAIDENLDGVINDGDDVLGFIGNGLPARYDWIRNRRAVGERLLGQRNIGYGP